MLLTPPPLILLLEGNSLFTLKGIRVFHNIFLVLIWKIPLGALMETSSLAPIAEKCNKRENLKSKKLDNDF